MQHRQHDRTAPAAPLGPRAQRARRPVQGHPPLQRARIDGERRRDIDKSTVAPPVRRHGTFSKCQGYALAMAPVQYTTHDVASAFWD